MDLEEIGINAGNWVDSAQERNYWRALVNAALNLRARQEEKRKTATIMDEQLTGFMIAETWKSLWHKIDVFGVLESIDGSQLYRS